jgi:hypothetical protein
MPQTARNPDTESSGKRPSNHDWKLYGVDFAKGCSDSEKVTDVVRKQPSLTKVIRHHERKWFEQI